MQRAEGVIGKFLKRLPKRLQKPRPPRAYRRAVRSLPGNAIGIKRQYVPSSNPKNPSNTVYFAKARRKRRAANKVAKLSRRMNRVNSR